MLRPFSTTLCVILLLGSRPLGAQGRGVELSYGRWWVDDAYSSVYSATRFARLVGPVSFGIGFFHRDDSRSSFDRTQTGGDLSLRVGGATGFYALSSVGIGIKHTDGNADASWSAGAGYGVVLFSHLRLGAEARYRVEDQNVKGFWQLRPDDRRGFQLQLGVGFTLGRSSRAAPPAGYAAQEPLEAPTADEIMETAGTSGLDDEAAALATNVVETALNAMGTPYQWGGSGENGFDCSGLIQYAYKKHGIILPRVSRDQARSGIAIDKSIGALAPGDVLTFAVNGNGVSHVGLYVGDGMFIHSSSQGVRLSSLESDDGDSRWWRARWVGVRRVLN